jgi:hypothetical protein
MLLLVIRSDVHSICVWIDTWYNIPLEATLTQAAALSQTWVLNVRMHDIDHG